MATQKEIDDYKAAYDKKMIADLQDRYDRLRMKEFTIKGFFRKACHKVTYYTEVYPMGVASKDAIAYDEITGEFECTHSYPAKLFTDLEPRPWFKLVTKLWGWVKVEYKWIIGASLTAIGLYIAYLKL